MALILGDRDEIIKVISRKDGSVRCEEEFYDEYLKCLDESLLDLDPDVEPTRFVMKKILSHVDDIAVKNETVKVDMKGNPNIQLGFMQKAVQVALLRIEQPDSLSEDQKIKYKMISNKIDEETISWLDQVGVLKDLYSAKENAASGKDSENVKKS
jgi:hypothetical protein